MSEPKDNVKDDAMKLAKLIGKMMGDIQQLKKDVEWCTRNMADIMSKLTTIGAIQLAHIDHSADGSLHAKVSKIMMKNADFLNHALNDTMENMTPDEIADEIIKSDVFDADESDRQSLIENFEAVKQDLTIARMEHEMGEEE